MSKLTDDEIGELLRETFADNEKLIDQLPQTTKRRHTGPILLAVAAVLAVLAGVLYGVQRVGDPDPASPLATSGVTGGPDPAPQVARAAATDNGDIWGAVIVALARKVEPADGWQAVRVFGQYQAEAQFRLKSGKPAVVPTFSAVDKERIEQTVDPLAPVEWGGPDPDCGQRRIAVVTVGAVVDKGDHKEVHASVFSDCGRGSILTYRVEKLDGVWKVTGTVGTTTGVIPLGRCPAGGTTPASPRAAC